MGHIIDEASAGGGSWGNM